MRTVNTVLCKRQYEYNAVAVETSGSSEMLLYLCFMPFLQEFSEVSKMPANTSA
jgi:hypothetical protein